MIRVEHVVDHLEELIRARDTPGGKYRVGTRISGDDGTYREGSPVPIEANLTMWHEDIFVQYANLEGAERAFEYLSRYCGEEPLRLEELDASGAWMPIRSISLSECDPPVHFRRGE